MFCFGVTVTGDDEPPRHPDQIPYYIAQERRPRPRSAPRASASSAARCRSASGCSSSTIGKNRTDSVRLIQLWLAGVLADTVGVLLALLWTAGFLPTFLEPQAVTVLLAKPAPRWALLVGKYLGVVLFVALHAALFVAGTWIGIGVSTGVWDAAYWLAVPLLVVNFAVFYAFSAFLAVCTRSTVVAVFGTLLFWVLCWAMNLTHHHIVGVRRAGHHADVLVPRGGRLLDAAEAAGHERVVLRRDEGPELLGAGAGADGDQGEGRVLPGAVGALVARVRARHLALAAYEFRKTDY